MSVKRILIVEEERILASVVEDFLTKRGPNYGVISVRSVAEALHVVLENKPDLVISEHSEAAGIDGLDLLRCIKEMEVPVRIILRADPTHEGDRHTALSLGCSTFLVKPFSEERFVELVSNMLQPIQGFTGRLVGMKLEDVVQMFCYRKDSTLLSVSHNGSTGVIYVDNGGIIHVQCDSISGVEAFYEIVGWESGEFLSQVILSVPPRTVFVEWQSLLMEGIRQRDEIRHALDPMPRMDTGVEELPEGDEGRVLHMVPFFEFEPDAEDFGEKRIMIVDDSRFIRKIVKEIVESDSRLSVVGYATNGQEALARIDELKPDLILLDWDMPVMKGSTTLMHIMIRSPCPVVVLSGFVGGVGANPFDLLCLGGVDFLRKPQNNWRIDGRADDLVRRVKEACGIKFERIRRVRIPSVVAETSDVPHGYSPAKNLSVFGSSTGGCTDLIRIVPLLPADLPCAAVVLHDMQQQAIGAFIDYLDRRSRIRVRPLDSGETLLESVCYVHPSSVPLELTRAGGAVAATILSDLPGDKVLDHFLISASKVMGKNLIAVLLSGGKDKGIEGLRAVKQVEGVTLVQDPMSSVDPRMAEAALKEGIVDHKCLADNLAETFQTLVKRWVSGLPTQESSNER